VVLSSVGARAQLGGGVGDTLQVDVSFAEGVKADDALRAAVHSDALALLGAVSPLGSALCALKGW